MEDYPQIHSVIAEQATFCPDRVALQMHSEGRLTDQYTYGQLVNCFQLGSKQKTVPPGLKPICPHLHLS
jgi:hypothetical protein